MRCQLTACLAGVMLLAGLPLNAAVTDVRVTWRELPPVVEEKRIELALPGGAHLRGKLLSIDSGSLVLDVSKTSDRRSYPKGETRIPRASVHSLTIVRTGATWKVACTAIGLAIGLAIAIPVNAYAHNEGDGAPAAIAAIVAVPAALGFLMGRSLDRKTVTVTITD